MRRLPNVISPLKAKQSVPKSDDPGGLMSALPPKADNEQTCRHVCFVRTFALQQKYRYSITSSPRASRVGGIETERALAVLRLPPISDRNFEDDLAFGVTFLDILVR